MLAFRDGSWGAALACATTDGHRGSPMTQPERHTPAGGVAAPPAPPSAAGSACVWEELFQTAAPGRRAQLLALAGRDGVLYAHQLPPPGNGAAPRPLLPALLNGQLQDLLRSTLAPSIAPTPSWTPPSATPWPAPCIPPTCASFRAIRDRENPAPPRPSCLRRPPAVSASCCWRRPPRLWTACWSARPTTMAFVRCAAWPPAKRRRRCRPPCAG